jgi:TolA-binding protein
VVFAALEDRIKAVLNFGLMPMRQHIFAIAGFIILLPLAAAAQPLIQSQEGIALQNQILQLQSQVQQLQASGNAANASGSSLGGSAAPAPSDNATPSGAAPSSDIVSSLLNQVSQLQAQVQQLSGRIDTLQNQVDTQHAATEKEIGDLNFKVSGAAAPGAPISPGAAPPPPGPGAPQSLTAGTLGGGPSTASPAIAIRAAQAALVAHNYATAETNARAVLAKAKTSPEGYKAQYILAESLYGENRPQDAAIAFDDAYNRDRTGTNAPGALLGLANSLTDIQQTTDACETLSSLDSQFPTPPAGMGPRIQAAKHRANCN